MDLELELQIELLRETKRKYESVLQLGRALTAHLYSLLQTQHALGDAFADLSQKSPELQVPWPGQRGWGWGGTGPRPSQAVTLQPPSLPPAAQRENPSRVGPALPPAALTCGGSLRVCTEVQSWRGCGRWHTRCLTSNPLCIGENAFSA